MARAAEGAKAAKAPEMKRRVPFFLLFALLLLSCSRPSSYEEFVKLSDSDDGVFEFRIDMSDITGTYDLFLFTRTDRSEVLGISERKPQKLVMEWVSPSERVYDECVYMDLGDYYYRQRQDIKALRAYMSARKIMKNQSKQQ